MSAHNQLLRISLSLFSTLLLLLLLLFPVILVSASASSSHTTKETLGIPPQDEMYFKSAVIKCRDGSKKFSKEQLNDDFCDCPDGTDEPGTSACPEGRFYCRNAGHIPLSLFSSRVNDGICDCCDGSDEYDGKVKCQNTCWEAGKAARDKLKKKIATYLDGVAIRKKEVEQAKETIAKDEAELVKLKSEEKILKGLVQQLKDRKEQIEKAEDQERREKEKEEQKRREAEEKAHEDEQQSPVDIADENSQHGEEKLPDSPNVVAEEIGEFVGETQHNSPTGNEAAPVHVEEGDVDTSAGDENVHDAMSGDPSHHSEKEKEGSQLSKEELGRLVASRWTSENTQEQQHKTVANEAEPHEIDDRTNEAEQHGTNPEDDYDGYSSEADEENRKYGDDDSHDNDDAYNDEDEDPLASYSPDEDKSDFSAPSSSSWLDKIQETVKTVLEAVNLFKTPVDKSEAAQIRKEYDESSAKLSKLQSRISTLTKKLASDYGPEKEFYSFYDHCFENRENKYVYKVCPFKEASQLEGYSTTRLGRWEKFGDYYKVMLFLHGDKCWNGPDRSLKVKLRCGLKNELSDVDEPSRCEYVALLSTPAVCLEERLKELQHKLEWMKKDLPQSHDEL